MNDLYEKLFALTGELKPFNPEVASAIEDSINFASTGIETLMSVRWNLRKIDTSAIKSEKLKAQISLAIN